MMTKIILLIVVVLLLIAGIYTVLHRQPRGIQEVVEISGDLEVPEVTIETPSFEEEQSIDLGSLI